MINPSPLPLLIECRLATKDGDPNGLARTRDMIRSDSVRHYEDAVSSQLLLIGSMSGGGKLLPTGTTEGIDDTVGNVGK